MSRWLGLACRVANKSWNVELCYPHTKTRRIQRLDRIIMGRFWRIMNGRQWQVGRTTTTTMEESLNNPFERTKRGAGEGPALSS